MIRVTNEFHYVKADSKLRHRWSILMFKAAAAYAMRDTVSYNKLYQIVSAEYTQWKANAEKECKKNHIKTGLVVVRPISFQKQIQLNTLTAITLFYKESRLKK